MVQYDSQVIRDYADSLYTRANFIVWRDTFVGTAVAAAIGYAGSSVVTEEPSNILFLSVGVGIIGAILGWQAGNDRAFALRLQAQTVLCQVQIEENTRSTAGRGKSIRLKRTV